MIHATRLAAVCRRLQHPDPVFWLLAGQFAMIAGVAATLPIVPLHVRWA